MVQVWDESLFAISASEMVDSGDWIGQTFLGALDYYNSKPPLHVWLVALSFTAFGPGLVSLRLPAMIAAWLDGGAARVVGLACLRPRRRPGGRTGAGHLLRLPLRALGPLGQLRRALHAAGAAHDRHAVGGARAPVAPGLARRDRRSRLHGEGHGHPDAARHHRRRRARDAAPATGAVCCRSWPRPACSCSSWRRGRWRAGASTAGVSSRRSSSRTSSRGPRACSTGTKARRTTTSTSCRSITTTGCSPRSWPVRACPAGGRDCARSRCRPAPIAPRPCSWRRGSRPRSCSPPSW